MADAGIISTHWSGFCTPGGHGPVAMSLDGGFCNGVHIFGNSIIVEPGCTASISWSGRWHPFQKHPSSIGAVTMELVDDQGKVWSSATGQVTSKSEFASLGGGAEAVPGRLPLGTSYRLMATVQSGTMCPPDDPKGKLIIDARGRPALKDAPRGGPRLPHDAMPVRIKGHVHTRMTRFGLKIRHWPKKRGKKATAAQKRAREDFKQMVTLVQQVPPWDRGAAQAIAHDSGWTYRDVLSKAVTGTLWSVPGMQSAALPFILDALSSVEGAMLYRGPDGWVGLLPGTAGEVISMLGAIPAWVDPSTLNAGITQLHGDVLAGPGHGNVFATIGNSGVVAGTYHHATLQVTGDGRVIDAANGEAATTAALGLVTPDGTTITIDGAGKISATATTPGIATTTVNGVSRPDGTTVTINLGGQLTAVYQSPPAATLSVNGIVRPDGTTITVDGAGVLTSLAGGGGGTGGLYSGAMSALPTQTTTGFTSNAGGGTVTDTVIGLVMTGTTAGVWLHKALPTGIKAFRGLFQMTNKTSSFNACAIGFSDGTKAVVLQNQWTGSAWQLVVNQFSAVNVYSSTPYNDPGGKSAAIIWMKCYDDGTNINFMISQDGLNFVAIYSQARLSYLASVSQVVIGSFPGSGPTNTITTLSSYGESAT